MSGPHIALVVFMVVNALSSGVVAASPTLYAKNRDRTATSWLVEQYIGTGILLWLLWWGA